MNSNSAARIVTPKSTSSPRSFGDLYKESQESRGKIKQNFRKSITSIKAADIRIPSWFGKKFVSGGELEQAISGIQSGGIANETIVVSYRREKDEGRYELVDGLVALKAYIKLGFDKVECELIDDQKFTKSQAMLASIALNTRQSLNPWESTLAGVNYLVEELGLETTTEWTPVIGVGTRTRRVVTQIDWAVGLCKTLLKIRRMTLNLQNGKQVDSELYGKYREQVSPEAEEAINTMLIAVNIDLATFIEKRVKLLELPKNITGALSSGKIHYNKAISISKVGQTPEIKALTERLCDVDVRDDVIQERAAILEEAIAKNLSNKEVLSLVHQANNRIFVKGTNEDDNSLSIDEIGERRQCKEDLILQSRALSDLSKTTATIKCFEVIDHLTEEEKIDLQKRVKYLYELVSDLKKKALSR